MPPVGLLLGKTDFSNLFVVLKEGSAAGPYINLADAQKVGAVTLNYGLLINSIISFLIVAFAVFLLIRWINRLKRTEETQASPDTKECPYCFSAVRIKVMRALHFRAQ
jgi:large conductance mechanosensitive channel